eukprot:GFUD01107250.1.p1 GENE.GFUD01107250.1~~GFUD01107250.1.p1  ORF type:complete len:143 (-),score=28.25 GFUD01107250.1:51-443(-)
MASIDEPRWRSSRVSQRATKFSFRPEHKTAASRVNKCRERRRVKLTVRKTRGLPPVPLPETEVTAELSDNMEDEKQQEQEDSIEEQDEQDQNYQREDDSGKEDNVVSSPKTKPRLIVIFVWNRKNWVEVN